MRGVGVRKGRLKVLAGRARAASRIARAGLVPLVTYGAGVRGLSDATIRALQKLVHAAGGRVTARSSYARLTLTGGLSAAAAAVAPLVSWARAWWDNTVPADTLREAWRCASARAIDDPNSARCGPAGAALHAAHRIGWTLPSPSCALEADGNVLCMFDEAPRTIERAALEAFDDWAAKRSSVASRIGGVPIWSRCAIH